MKDRGRRDRRRMEGEEKCNEKREGGQREEEEKGTLPRTHLSGCRVRILRNKDDRKVT